MESEGGWWTEDVCLSRICLSYSQPSVFFLCILYLLELSLGCFVSADTHSLTWMGYYGIHLTHSSMWTLLLKTVCHYSSWAAALGKLIFKKRLFICLFELLSLLDGLSFSNFLIFQILLEGFSLMIRMFELCICYSRDIHHRCYPTPGFPRQQGKMCAGDL